MLIFETKNPRVNFKNLYLSNFGYSVEPWIIRYTNTVLDINLYTQTYSSQTNFLNPCFCKKSSECSTPHNGKSYNFSIESSNLSVIL